MFGERRRCGGRAGGGACAAGGPSVEAEQVWLSRPRDTDASCTPVVQPTTQLALRYTKRLRATTTTSSREGSHGHAAGVYAAATAWPAACPAATSPAAACPAAASPAAARPAAAPPAGASPAAAVVANKASGGQPAH
eukprot:350207-Chlamydomonas_euryale.AAC.1